MLRRAKGWVAALVVGFGLAFLTFTVLQVRGAMPGVAGWMRPEPVWRVEDALGRIETVAKMTLVEQSVQAVVDFEDGRWGRNWLLGKQAWAKGTARIGIGFDLTGWDLAGQTKVDEGSKRIEVRLPEPQVISVQPDQSSIDILSTSGVFRSSDLSNEEQTEITRRLLAAFEREPDPFALETAKRQMASLLTETVLPLGYTVEVAFGAGA